MWRTRGDCQRRPPDDERRAFFILYNTQFDLVWLLCFLAFCAFLR